MGEHKRRRRRQRRYDWNAVRERLQGGAAVGFIMAAAGLGIGLLGAIVVQLSGRTVAFDNLVMGVTLYAGGFIVAGVVIGLLWSWHHDWAGRFILGIVGAAIVFAFITRMESGPVRTWGRDEGIQILVFALMFGIPMGYQFGKQRL